MPKFFVLSDVHGFYDKMIEALKKTGFDEQNENHWLVSCGDCFDRGLKPDKVMQYFKNLPRKVLVKGNHEIMFEEMCQRGYPEAHDYSNGTVATVRALSGKHNMGEAVKVAYEKAHPFINSMRNYFETKNYIFVHSWVPLIYDPGSHPYYYNKRVFSFRENWREANDLEWEEAMWGNPFQMAEDGLLPDKTIVFGHWHCSYGWSTDKSNRLAGFEKSANWNPYYGRGYIGIDACTPVSGKVNVIVLEDEFLVSPDSKKLS